LHVFFHVGLVRLHPCEPLDDLVVPRTIHVWARAADYSPGNNALMRFRISNNIAFSFATDCGFLILICNPVNTNPNPKCNQFNITRLLLRFPPFPNRPPAASPLQNPPPLSAKTDNRPRSSPDSHGNQDCIPDTDTVAASALDPAARPSIQVRANPQM